MENVLVLLKEYTELNNNWVTYIPNVIPTLQEVRDFSAKEQEIKDKINQLGYYIFLDSTKTVKNRYNLKSIKTNLPINM